MLKNILRFFISIIFIITIFTIYKINNKYVEINNITNTISKGYNDCFSVLIIDKINLNKCLQENDNVNENIEIIKNDKTIVLAGHSGNGEKAYFKKLHLMNIDDTFYYYYNNIKYECTIYDIQLKKKKDIFKYKNKDNIIILVTCSEDNKNQIIFYVKMQKID